MVRLKIRYDKGQKGDEMVLQALSRPPGGRASTGKADMSATGRTSVQNSRITSFFSPLTHSRIAKEEDVSDEANSLNGHIARAQNREASDPSSTPNSIASDRVSNPNRLRATHIKTRRNGVPSSPQNKPEPSQTSREGTPRSNNAVADKKSSPRETRKLRSKKKAIYKSELAAYFPNYEDIITDAPQQPELVLPDEVILIVDEPCKGSAANSPAKTKSPMLATRPKPPPPPPPPPHTIIEDPESPLLPPHAKVLHLVSPTNANLARDPLSDDMYLIHHRRAERREKQLRNIEKERAQHEKFHLERILDGLQGPDWLRVLGVTGVTESEQKDWRAKRDYFVKEVTELVDKFRRWREEERRMRQEKERAREESEAEDEDEDEDVESDADSSASSDVDASAAMQLLQEAGLTPKEKFPKRRKMDAQYEAPPSPELPFVTFYKDDLARFQAFDEADQGSGTTAFGEPLPNPPEEVFELYEDWTMHDSRRARDHKRRKLKKEPITRREFL